MEAFAALEGTQLLDLYLGFVADFATKLDQIKLMQFLIKVSDQYKSENMKKKIHFSNILLLNR
jgi:hypothetical protein